MIEYKRILCQNSPLAHLLYSPNYCELQKNRFLYLFLMTFQTKRWTDHIHLFSTKYFTIITCIIYNQLLFHLCFIFYFSNSIWNTYITHIHTWYCTLKIKNNRISAKGARNRYKFRWLRACFVITFAKFFNLIKIKKTTVKKYTNTLHICMM